ncbi:MAG: transporter substrate-binding domain-containing protein [Azospirillum sp.]|nr:transporter substrate-binding domain-containing protein [Azospirillum sp.]
MTGPFRCAVLALALFSMLVADADGQTGTGPASVLQAVRARGQLRCGVSTGLPGFSTRTEAGRWVGFDVAYCRALAAAVLGDAERVEFVPGLIQQGLTALVAAEIDVLSRNATITLRRVAEMGLHPIGVYYFDGQGFLLRASAGVRALHQLDGRSICYQSGTTAEDNLKEIFGARRIAFTAVAAASFRAMIDTFIGGGCDAITADASTLAVIQITALPRPDDFVILRQHISKEPFGPLVRDGDDRWQEIARWTLMALIEAEELGVSSVNVEAMTASENPRIQRLLGVIPGLGEALGLDRDWARRIVAQVGNYEEIFQANLGMRGPLKLDRGLNELWTRGGLLFAFPLR